MKSLFKTGTTLVLGLAAVVAAAGCSTSEMAVREDVTRAALSEYPGQARPSDRLKLAAVDDPGRQTLEISNLSDTAVTTAKVWVNSRYVQAVPAIPARSTVTIGYADLLEAGRGTMDLARVDKPQIAKVEVQTADGLFTVDGPARR